MQSGLKETLLITLYLVEIARPANRPNLISVVEEADAGLSQAVTLSDLDLSKPFDKLHPNI